jgi:hypothetical protein
MAWSPDGNRLACVFALSPEAANLNDPSTYLARARPPVGWDGSILLT